MAVWICICFDRLGVEVQPAVSAEQPRAVIERGRVRLVNTAAEDIGISAGLRTSTAYGICPQLEVLDANPTLVAERLRQLAELAGRFSPVVSLAAPDSVLLEVDGSLHLFGGLRGIAASLGKLYHPLGHQPQFGYAHTPLAATVLARAGQHCQAIAPSELADCALQTLRQLPARHLEPVPGLDTITSSSTLSATLSTMGIRNIGQLLDLPRAPLNRRFGPALLKHLDRLVGRRPDPRQPLHQAHRFRRKANFLEDIPDREALLFPMQRMLTELGCWLIAHQLATAHLHWQFRHEHFGNVAMPVHMATAHTSPQHFLNLTRLTLERTDLPERITTLILQVRSPTPVTTSTGTLFTSLGRLDTGQSAAHHLPHELLDLLQARLGHDCCQHLRRTGDHRPEHAWQNKTTDAVSQPPAPDLHARPVWLLDPPQPVNIGQLRLVRGPERIHAGWWEGHLASAPPPRDYYAAVHPSGALCWVFRNCPRTGAALAAPADHNKRVDSSWFIHGYFG